MFFIYILKSFNFSKTYVGITNNLNRRLKEHNSGKSRYSSNFRPWQLIYAEKLSTLKGVRLKEKYFKSAAGRKQMKKLFQ